MRKSIISAVLLAGFAVNAAAYFDGSVTGTTGPDSYRGTNINLLIGWDNIAFEPTIKTYSFEAGTPAETYSYRTYALRGALEKEKYTVGAQVGMTPEKHDYSNRFFGGDITFTLTPGGGGHARLAGPGSRGGARGGQGITRIDFGAGIKHTMHTTKMTVGSDKETAQTEATVFAGAKVLMINLSGSYAGYKYGDDDSSVIGSVPGHNFADTRGALPKSSVNFKLDIPGQPLVTPFLSYTSTKYKGTVKDSDAYLLGAYIDLNMVMANIGYQIFDNGDARDSFVTLGAGVKF